MTRHYYDKAEDDAMEIVRRKDDKMEQAMTFNNGLTAEHDDEIDNITIALSRLTQRIEELGRHRSYSTAIKKIDEARHWLRDRKHRPA